jgi:hypothetical protein
MVIMPDMSLKSEPERAFETLLRWRKIPDPEWHYRFTRERRWHLDAAWPAERVAVEIQGGLYGPTVRCNFCGKTVTKVGADGKPYPVREAGGRHVRGTGYESDMEKHNAAIALGWTLLYLTPTQIENEPNEFLDMLHEMLEVRHPQLPSVLPTTPQERSAVAAWMLASGSVVSTKDLSERLDLSRRGVRRMINSLAEILPIRRENGLWQRR